MGKDKAIVGDDVQHWTIPEDIKERFVMAAAQFAHKTGASGEEVTAFMLEILYIFDDYQKADSIAEKH